MNNDFDKIVELNNEIIDEIDDIRSAMNIGMKNLLKQPLADSLNSLNKRIEKLNEKFENLKNFLQKSNLNVKNFDSIIQKNYEILDYIFKIKDFLENQTINVAKLNDIKQKNDEIVKNLLEIKDLVNEIQILGFKEPFEVKNIDNILKNIDELLAFFKKNKVEVKGVDDIIKKIDKLYLFLENYKNNDVLDILNEIKNYLKQINFQKLPELNFSSLEKILEKINTEIKKIPSSLSKNDYDFSKLEKSFEKLETAIKNIKVSIVGGGGIYDAPVFLKDTSAKLVNPATKDYQNILSPYQISDIDDASSVKYYGFLKENGEWYILKEDTTNKTFRYIKGDSNYSTAWTNRGSLNYDYFDVIF